jgi:hypothetical protein
MKIIFTLLLLSGVVFQSFGTVDLNKISWIRFSENGTFSVEDVSGGLLIQKPGYKATASENELNSIFKEEIDTIELDTKIIEVSFTPFKDWKPIKVIKKITLLGENSVHYSINLDSQNAHDIACLGYTFRLPAKNFVNKDLQINGKPVHLPLKFDELHLATGEMKSIVIPLANGSLTISGNYKFKLQDLRKWNIAAYSLHFHIPFKKPFKKAEFELSLNYQSIKLPTEEFDNKKPNFSMINLDGAANASTIDDAPGNGQGGWTDQGGVNDLRSFDKSGKVILKGIPFIISDLEKNNNKNCIIAAGPNWTQYPADVTIPLDDQTAKGIYFLHTSAWTPQELGEYKINYSDGTSSIIKLRNLKEIFNWWTPGEAECTIIGWYGRNPANAIGLSLFAWTNPFPTKKISSISISVYKQNPQAVMMLLGLTLADGIPYLWAETGTVAKNIDDSNWIEIAKIDESIAPGTVIDASDLVPAPAGKFGFVKAKGESFVFPNGKEVHFLGFNIETQHCFPSRQQADFHAKRLRRMGINAVRMHKFDKPTRAGISILDPSSEAGELSTENLDSFEYFIAQLKKNGIYLVMDLQTLRLIGAKECPQLAGEQYRVYGMFIPELIEAQKRFITRMLTHRNPYTGLSLIEDPALALIAFQNENSLLYQANLNKIKSPYALNILKEQFNKWLLKKYKDRNALLSAWDTLSDTEDPAHGTVELPMNPSGKKYSVARSADVRRFFYDIQSNYYREIRTHLLELGIKIPMTGSNHWTRDPLDFELNSQQDYTDRHNYWAHPTVAGSWLLDKIMFNPAPMVKDPGAGLVGVLAGRRVLGKPFTVTEWNDASTNEFRADAQLIFPAYSSMHNWHIFQFTYSTRQTNGKFLRPITYSFGIDDDPLQLALYPLISRMFLRKDIATSNSEYALYITEKELNDPAYILDPVNVRKAALYTRAGLRFESGKPNTTLIPNTACEVASETNELFWDIKTGRSRIDTARTQGFVGFPGGTETITCKNLELKLDSDFAAVCITSCDDEPLESSERMLLVTVARGWNKGMKYNAMRNRITNAGSLPLVMQPVKGTVAFSGKHPQYRVERLDISGRKLGPVKTDSKNGKISFELDNAIYYEITALAD